MPNVKEISEFDQMVRDYMNKIEIEKNILLQTESEIKSILERYL